MLQGIKENSSLPILTVPEVKATNLVNKLNVMKKKQKQKSAFDLDESDDSDFYDNEFWGSVDVNKAKKEL